MTREQNEQWYDVYIAPALADMADQCHARGMPFLAAVGNQGDRYCTRFLTDKTDPALRQIYYATKALGNVDALVLMLMQDAEKYGGTENSIYLTNLKRYSEALERGRL